MLFKLNFGRHSWKEHLIIKTKLPKQKTFLEELQRGWKIAKSSIEREKEAMKKQFNKESDSQRSWARNTIDFSNHKEDWTRSIPTRIIRRIGDT